MLPGSTAPTPTAWWQAALVRFADIGRRWLKAKFPGMRNQHDDLLGESLLQITAQIRQGAEDFPASWFADAEPPEDDVKRFHGLAFTVLSRRVQDEFRLEYRDWMESLEDLPEDQMPACQAPDPATALAHTRAVRALMSTMLAMSLRDRLLVERVALGDKSAPLSGAERERVRSLRASLRQQLGNVLGDRAPASTKKNHEK